MIHHVEQLSRLYIVKTTLWKLLRGSVLCLFPLTSGQAAGKHVYWRLEFVHGPYSLTIEIFPPHIAIFWIVISSFIIWLKEIYPGSHRKRPYLEISYFLRWLRCDKNLFWHTPKKPFLLAERAKMKTASLVRSALGREGGWCDVSRIKVTLLLVGRVIIESHTQTVLF